MNKNETKAIDSIIDEFEENFNANPKFNIKVMNYLENHEDDWAEIMEAKDDLEEAIMVGVDADDSVKKTLANAFSAVAAKVFSHDELKASFPQSTKKLSNVDIPKIGIGVKKLSAALDI